MKLSKDDSIAAGRLYDKLVSYQEEDYYPMHMPGHKRNTNLMQMMNPYGIDITEIEGFDNLHQYEGILRQLSERLSRLYCAKKSFLLVNGSTAGILSGISAATHRGDKILMARNCHKAVYHGVVQMGLVPVYSYPQKIEEIPVNGGICAEEIEAALIKEKNISLVVITSPTYEGIVSDIKSIAEAVHRHGALLLVDEAHGAHLGFHPGFPESAVVLGADIIIQSLHKTLPAFTQTAVLHSNREELNNRLQRYLTIYQSSSPSYILMAGVDRCVSLLEEQVEHLFHDYDRRLKSFYQAMKGLQRLKLLGPEVVGRYGVYDIDPSKITISVRDTNLSGHELNRILYEKYHMVMEMETPEYVLGMTSICDTEEGFLRLSKALLAIDREWAVSDNKPYDSSINIIKPLRIMLPGTVAEDCSYEQVKLIDSRSRISAVLVCMYPPGSPILVPGERINEEVLDYLRWIKQKGITITGLCGEEKDEIEVVSRKDEKWDN